MRTLIVDDESLARRLLRNYVSKVADLELAGVCQDGKEAMEAITTGAIDLMFLDIQMPEMTGIEVLSALEKPPITIFTTAYEQYALKGYEFQVIDYLLKPFTFERFEVGVNKAREYFQLLKGAAPEEKSYFFVKADYKLQKVFFDEILYVEGMREYVRIHTTDRRITLRQTMSLTEENLSTHAFARIHRSFIINLKHIQSVQPTSVVIAGQELPVSKGYKESFRKQLGEG